MSCGVTHNVTKIFWQCCWSLWLKFVSLAWCGTFLHTMKEHFICLAAEWNCWSLGPHLFVSLLWKAMLASGVVALLHTCLNLSGCLVARQFDKISSHASYVYLFALPWFPDLSFSRELNFVYTTYISARYRGLENADTDDITLISIFHFRFHNAKKNHILYCYEHDDQCG